MGIGTNFGPKGHNKSEMRPIDNAREQPKTSLSKTDEVENPNRYTTEHGQNNLDAFASSTLSLELVEIINMWPQLPDSIRNGVMAIIRTIISQ
jgi:hypothetical protein